MYYTHNTSGTIHLSDGITFTPSNDLNGPSPQFTLTCISTGGPATTVTWTRDSVTVTEGTETVLDDPVTAQYTHTLTGSTAGVYTCTVANNKPSRDSAHIAVKGIAETVIVFRYTVRGLSLLSPARVSCLSSCECPHCQSLTE